MFCSNAFQSVDECEEKKINKKKKECESKKMRKKDNKITNIYSIYSILG